MNADGAFGIETRDDGGTIRLAVTGDLDLASESRLYDEVTRRLPSLDGNRVLLDLTRVTFLDSSGLRALLRCRDAAEQAGHPLTLVLGGNERVRGLLDVAGVTAWFRYE